MKTKSFRQTYAERAHAFEEGFASKAKTRDGEFAQYCKEILDKLCVEQSRLDRMYEHFEEVGFGATFKHDRLEQWALILPDASEKGKFRYQQFCASYMISHHTCDSAEEAVYEACENGFYQPAATSTLDDISKSTDWLLGMESGDLIFRVNRGEISYAEAQEIYAGLQVKYGRAA